MQGVCEDLKTHREEVVRIFDDLARRRPWAHLPEENRIDALPELIIGLVEAAICNPKDIATHRQKVKAALEHGQSRYGNGYTDHLLLEEYDLLREAIWTYVQRKFGQTGRTSRVIVRIDAAITLATRASLVGFHSASYEPAQLEETIDQLAQVSPLLHLDLE